MSMYSELLGAALRALPEDVAGGPAEGRLLGELAECRRKLPVTAGAASARLGVDAAGGIAVQIDYDLALLRLARLHGIETDPARFTRPEAERRRLEHALADAGVDVMTVA